jgi:hypothetical protein
MNNILVQFVGLLFLIVLTGWGYWRWIRPYPSISNEAKGLLLLILLTMAGGLIGSTGWWIDDRSAFPWDLPPLASRLLAVAGWAFGAAAWMTLRHPVRSRLYLILLMLFTYLAPLAAAIVLFHLDRFDFLQPIATAFFILVALLLLPTLWYLVRRPVVLPADEHDFQPPASGVRVWLILVAIVTGLWGAALFSTDQGGVAAVWVWSGDLLTSRLIAVMLLTLMVAAIYSLRAKQAAQVTLATVTVYGLGAALASLWNALADKPVPGLYVLVFGSMGVISLLLMWRKAA